MRYALLLLLVALIVVLVLSFGTGKKSNPVEEANAALDRTKAAMLPSQLQQVEAALNAFADERGSFPGDISELVPAYLGYDDLLVDPWGTRLRLEHPAEGGAFLASAGPDRTFATGDDIRRSL